MDVVEAVWPSQSALVDDLRRRGVPRLLLLEPGASAPLPVDGLEDWVRVDGSPEERAGRRAGLEVRARIWGVRPELEDRVLRFRRRWVSLSPVEHALAGALVERFGSVVARESLAARAWPDGLPTRNALDVHVLRLRRRIESLGLEIRTVRSRGYLLQEGAAASAATAASAAS